MKRKAKDEAPPSKTVSASVRYWQEKAAEYIRAKRGKVGQKETGIARQTMSMIENGRLNFTLQMLVETLEAVNGDISELFQSPLPKDLRGEGRVWHEMLYEVMSSGEVDEMRTIESTLSVSYRSVVAKRRGRAS